MSLEIQLVRYAYPIYAGSYYNICSILGMPLIENEISNCQVPRYQYTLTSIVSPGMPLPVHSYIHHESI